MIITYHILSATLCIYDIEKFETFPISYFGNIAIISSQIRGIFKYFLQPFGMVNIFITFIKESFSELQTDLKYSATFQKIEQMFPETLREMHQIWLLLKRFWPDCYTFFSFLGENLNNSKTNWDILDLVENLIFFK